MARSSSNIHPCTLFDSEFWLKPKYRYCYNHRHPQAVVNVEFAKCKHRGFSALFHFIAKVQNHQSSTFDKICGCQIYRFCLSSIDEGAYYETYRSFFLHTDTKRQQHTNETYTHYRSAEPCCSVFIRCCKPYRMRR